MKKLKNKKFIRLSTIAFAGTLLFTTAVQGTSFSKKIDATFRGIKVYNNNQLKTVAQEPFIYNDSVYLPVRAVAELVDKNVDWNSATNSVYVADKPGFASNEIVQELQTQIATKNFEIARITAEKSLLESEIKQLKEETDKKPGSHAAGNIRETLAYIEDTFDYEHAIDWDFKLSETSSRINLEVSFDSRYDDRKWDNLTTAKRESFFRDIVREIRFDFKDIPINGTIVDRRTDKKVGSFSYSKTNSFFYDDNSATSFDTLERALVKKYADLGEKIKLSIDDIKVTGNEDNITFTVDLYLSNGTLRSEWDAGYRYNEAEVRRLMLDIKEDIQYDYRHAAIQGYIEDVYSGNTLAKFDGTRLY